MQERADALLARYSPHATRRGSATAAAASALRRASLATLRACISTGRDTLPRYSRGTAEMYSIVAMQARAVACREWLVQHGVDRGRLRAETHIGSVREVGASRCL